MQNEKGKHYSADSFYLLASRKYNKFVEHIYRDPTPTLRLHGSAAFNIGSFFIIVIVKQIKN